MYYIIFLDFLILGDVMYNNNIIIITFFGCVFFFMGFLMVERLFRESTQSRI